MKKIFKSVGVVVAAVLILTVVFQACEETKDVLDKLAGLSEVLGEDGEVTDLFGWVGSEEENMDELEEDINFSSMGNQDLPSSVDLTPDFPPIGNQGAYGTCVAWALGYNLKTYLEGQDKGYSTTELASPSYQFSPKDLFWSIDNEYTGDDCNGTGFEYAFDMMVSRGIAKMNTVPYESLGDCSGSPQSGWTTEANEYKIDNYRKIDIDVDVLKGYLADGRPVAIGAKLGDDFMEWNSNDVINSDTYLNPGMQHAYHAMVLGGYNDNKGVSGAFRVVNSWATGWGDDGYIWVDYDFFVDEFCFAAFVATNVRSNPDDDGDNEVDYDDLVTGYDLVSWNLIDEDYYDEEDPDNEIDRFITYSVYNSGEEVIYATQDWNILYVYYNAYDADDYGILIFDYYTDDYGDNDDHYALIPDGDANAYGQVNWWNNIDVLAGQNVVAALLGEEYENFSFPYDVPTTLNGEFYFVLIADGFDVLNETDEDNNYLFFADDYGNPIPITDGVLDETYISYRKSDKERLSISTVKTERNVNAYSPAEISRMINYHRKTGKLREMAEQFDKVRKSAKIVNKAS